MAEHMELLGADYCEHQIFHPGVGVTRSGSAWSVDIPSILIFKNEFEIVYFIPNYI